MKVDKDSPYPRIYQAKAPHAVIGGNHVGADMLTQIVIDKHRCHLPEYCQVRKYADLGLKLPTSTLNGWGHAVASRQKPVYGALRDDVRNSDYLQIDEVPWRRADSPDKSRKGYAWQFLDNRPQSHGLYFPLYERLACGNSPTCRAAQFPWCNTD